MMARHINSTLAGGLALAAGFLLLAPASAQAQQGDARWLPWVGCWQATSEAGEPSTVCFRPDGQGVELLTLEDGQVTGREALRADGVPRERSEEGCSGTDVLEFSDDGRRLYLTSEQVCEGGTTRSASGIIAMISPQAWIDVKSVEVAGERVAMVQLYRLASESAVEGAGLAGLATGREMAIRTARVAAASSPTPYQVVDASANVHEQAVQAWLAEAAEPFNLSASLVTGLAEAGVSPGTIDVMVAVSYPDHFVLGRDARRDGAARDATPSPNLQAMEAYGMDTERYRGPRSPFHWDPFYRSFMYYRYGYLGYGYGVDTYLYGFPGYTYGGWLGYRPTVVVVEPNDPGGRVVNGQGYTRRSGTASGSSYPTGRSGAVGSTTRGTSGSAGSSGTTRRAKPRGGGGGGGSF